MATLLYWSDAAWAVWKLTQTSAFREHFGEQQTSDAVALVAEIQAWLSTVAEASPDGENTHLD